VVQASSPALFGAGQRPAPQELIKLFWLGSSAGPDPTAGLVEARQIYIHGEQFKGMVTANGYDFEKLFPGNEIVGPAIIWSPITTVLVNPGQWAKLDRYKNIVLTW
jgi:N-methylhydantoinase A/oxoprolinase/acetone carboxylase beta subunit